MNYHKKYLKYKYKYLELVRHEKQIKGSYKFGTKVEIKNGDETLEGTVKQYDDATQTYTVLIDETGNFMSVKEKNIKLPGGKDKLKTVKLTESLEPSKSKSVKRKYDDGTLLKFTHSGKYNIKSNGEKMGRVIDFRPITDSNSEQYQYALIGPSGGKYTIFEDEIIRVVTEREFEKYAKKISASNGDDVTDNIIKYIDYTDNSNNSDSNKYIIGTMENRLGNFHELIDDKNCCLTLTTEILNKSDNLEKCLIKYFVNDNVLLLHELKIAVYIVSMALKNKSMTDIINDHINVIKEKQKISFESFAYLLQDFQTQITGSSTQNDVEEFTEYINSCVIDNNKNTKKKGMYGLVYSNIPDNINDMIVSVFDDKNIIKSVFNMLYCIYLLHEILDIMHNDCSLNNFRVADTDTSSSLQNYKIKDKNYEMTSNHFIKIDNFTNSIKIKKNTTSDEILSEQDKSAESCTKEGKCNKYNQRDIFVIVSSLLPLVFNKENDTINDLLYNIVLTITNSNYGLISAIIKKNNLMKDSDSNSFFSSFCKFNSELLLKTGDLEFKENDCEDTYIKDLDISQVIERYIEKYKVELGLKEIS
jgi:hypothetical protein